MIEALCLDVNFFSLLHEIYTIVEFVIMVLNISEDHETLPHFRSGPNSLQGISYVQRVANTAFRLPDIARADVRDCQIFKEKGDIQYY